MNRKTTLNSDLNCGMSADLSHAQVGSDSLGEARRRGSPLARPPATTRVGYIFPLRVDVINWNLACLGQRRKVPCVRREGESRCKASTSVGVELERNRTFSTLAFGSSHVGDPNHCARESESFSEKSVKKLNIDIKFTQNLHN
jgi:hypothetical protein